MASSSREGSAQDPPSEVDTHPPLRRALPTPEGAERRIAEFGVGVTLMSNVYQTDRKRFSTSFNFGDHVAVGRSFGLPRGNAPQIAGAQVRHMRARVNASTLKRLASVDATLNGDEETGARRGGVMLSPAILPMDEWESIAQPMQAKLVAETHADIDREMPQKVDLRNLPEAPKGTPAYSVETGLPWKRVRGQTSPVR